MYERRPFGLGARDSLFAARIRKPKPWDAHMAVPAVTWKKTKFDMRRSQGTEDIIKAV